MLTTKAFGIYLRTVLEEYMIYNCRKSDHEAIEKGLKDIPSEVGTTIRFGTSAHVYDLRVWKPQGWHFRINEYVLRDRASGGCYVDTLTMDTGCFVAPDTVVNKVLPLIDGTIYTEYGISLQLLGSSNLVETSMYTALTRASAWKPIRDGKLQDIVDILKGTSLSLKTTLHLYLVCQTVCAMYYPRCNLWLDDVEDGKRMFDRMLHTLEALVKDNIERKEAEAAEKKAAK